MSTESYSGLSVFVRKRLPKKLGGFKFYDHLLDRLTDISPAMAWNVFHQQFIDDVVNPKLQKWTAIPYLSPIQAPCSPGTVILLREKSLKEALLRRPCQAVMAGTLGDFCPHDRLDTTDAAKIAKDELNSGRELRKVYQARDSEKAVVITMVIQGQRRLVDFNMYNTYIDLDNFDRTGFDPERCYLVTNVLIADHLVIEVTLNGDVFYEHTFTPSLPVCYRAMKAWLEMEGCGKIERVKYVDSVLPIDILRRSQFQSFLNAFIPNQTKLSVGDFPPVMRWREPVPIRSFRPRFLPRPDRPSVDLFEMLPHDLDIVQIVNSTRGMLAPSANKEQQLGEEEQSGQRRAELEQQ